MADHWQDQLGFWDKNRRGGCKWKKVSTSSEAFAIIWAIEMCYLKQWLWSLSTGVGRLPPVGPNQFAVCFGNKCYWNTVTLIYLCIAYGCSPPPAAELSGCSRDQMASKVKKGIWPFTESLPTSDLESPGRRIMAVKLPSGYAKQHRQEPLFLFITILYSVCTLQKVERSISGFSNEAVWK